MAQLIICKKDQKWPIAEIVGESMLRIVKRKNDYHPFAMTLKGSEWDAVVACTNCSEPHHIECVDGKITKEGLIIKDKEEEEDGKNTKEQDAKPGADGTGGTDNPGSS